MHAYPNVRNIVLLHGNWCFLFCPLGAFFFVHFTRVYQNRWSRCFGYRFIGSASQSFGLGGQQSLPCHICFLDPVTEVTCTRVNDQGAKLIIIWMTLPLSGWTSSEISIFFYMVQSVWICIHQPNREEFNDEVNFLIIHSPLQENNQISMWSFSQQ